MDRRPSRWLLLAGAAVVLGGAILLVWAMRRGDEGERRDGTIATTPRSPTADRPSVTDRPVLPDRSERAGREGTPVVSESFVDGAQVRDHRTGARVPYEGRPRDGGVRTERLPPELVHDLSGKLKEAMTDCAAAIPAEARGSRPGVAGAVFVEVVGETLIVKETSLALRDVTGDAAESAKRCLEQSWVGQSIPARAAPETSRYEITVAFALPR